MPRDSSRLRAIPDFARWPTAEAWFRMREAPAEYRPGLRSLHGRRDQNDTAHPPDPAFTQFRWIR